MVRRSAILLLMAGQRAEEERRFEEYLGLLGKAIGHADRTGPLRAYLTGLLLAGERKSVEPMAAKVDPRHVSMRHQSMHHFVANAPWDERAVIAVARDYALAQLERHGPVAAGVVNDSGFPKKGTHSVGVARQYRGPMGKQDNCQVAVTLSLVNSSMSVPCAYRLYLPEAWTKVGPKIVSAVAPPRFPRRLVSRPNRNWLWREGTKGSMHSRFALTRVRPAHRDHLRVVPRAPESLLIEWPHGEPEPTRYWLSTLPPDTALAELVRLAKIRWRIERDFQELKDEIGLDHYEGRGWRGLHHHGALGIAAYAFLAAERARLPPSTACLPVPGSPTQRLLPARSRPCVLNGTTPLPSPPFESATRACSPRPCAPAPGAATLQAPKSFYDTVVLEAVS